MEPEIKKSDGARISLELNVGGENSDVIVIHQDEAKLISESMASNSKAEAIAKGIETDFQDIMRKFQDGTATLGQTVQSLEKKLIEQRNTEVGKFFDLMKAYKHFSASYQLHGYDETKEAFVNYVNSLPREYLDITD